MPVGSCILVLDSPFACLMLQWTKLTETNTKERYDCVWVTLNIHGPNVLVSHQVPCRGNELPLERSPFSECF